MDRLVSSFDVIVYFSLIFFCSQLKIVNCSEFLIVQICPLQIKKAILSAESSAKEFIFGSKKQSEESEIEKLGSENAKKNP